MRILRITLRQGLEDQLLGEVVRRERPDLEEARDRLVLSISADKRQLVELEDKVYACPLVLTLVVERERGWAEGTVNSLLTA
jgi:hypothetical protein